MASRYWVGATGTWDTSTTTHWSSTSGGSSGSSAPTISDDVYIDASSDSGASFVVTVVNSGVVCKSLTITVDQGLTINLGTTTSSTSNILVVHGAMSLNNLTTVNVFYKDYGVFVIAGTSCSYAHNGAAVNVSLSLGDGSTTTTLSLASNFLFGGSNGPLGLSLKNAATLTTNNYNVTFGAGSYGDYDGIVFQPYSGSTLNAGTSNISFVAKTSTTSFNTFFNAGCTLNISTCTFTNISGSGGSIQAGYTYGTVSLTPGGNNVVWKVTADLTIGTLIMRNGGFTGNGLTLTIGKILTISSSFDVVGTASKLIAIISSSAGTPATVSKASGTVSGDYLSIKDSTASGGAAWYAGSHSTSVSGNTGWIFTDSPYALSPSSTAWGLKILN